MPRRSLRPASRTACLGAALALLASLALGWGLPRVAADGGSRPLTSHAVRTAEVVADAVAATAGPVVDTADAIATRVDHTNPHARVRDALGATTCAIALLLLVARRRRLTFARLRVARVAVVAHGGRAPPR
ncbi:MAG: hypothetical protein U0W40_20270 [Acidimicrobiia bacterium]